VAILVSSDLYHTTHPKKKKEKMEKEEKKDEEEEKEWGYNTGLHIKTE